MLQALQKVQGNGGTDTNRAWGCLKKNNSTDWQLLQSNWSPPQTLAEIPNLVSAEVLQAGAHQA